MLDDVKKILTLKTGNTRMDLGDSICKNQFKYTSYMKAE